MRLYYTSIYCSKDGAGEVLKHKTAEAAREYLSNIWEHLTDSEKKKYKSGTYDTFKAFEIEATAEQLEQIESGDIAAEDLETANIKDYLKPALY